jgi:hypothetical protein
MALRPFARATAIAVNSASTSSTPRAARRPLTATGGLIRSGLGRDAGSVRGPTLITGVRRGIGSRAARPGCSAASARSSLALVVAEAVAAASTPLGNRSQVGKAADRQYEP